MSCRKIALFLSCIAFEDFFAQINTSKEAYVRSYYDWSFELIRLWQELGFETTIYHFSREADRAEVYHRDVPTCTIRFFPIPSSETFQPLMQGRHLLDSYLSSLSPQLFRALWRQKPGIIWVQEYESARFDILSAFGKLAGIPVVGQHHGAIGAYEGRGAFVRRWAVRNAAKLCCLNRNEYRRAASRYAVLSRERLEILHNPLDSDLFHPVDKESAKVRLGLDSETRYVLFVGRLHPHKGVPYLLEAYGEIRHKHPDTVLLLVGAGPLEDELKAIVANRRWEGIRFEGWVSSKDRLRLYHAASEFLVAPSLREGLPVVATEAMACERAVLGTTVDGLLELVMDGSNGLLVPPADSGALAEKMSYLLEHPGACEQMGRNGLALFEERYSTQALLSQMEQILYSLVRSR